SWTIKASMPTARRDLAAAAGTDGQIHVFGGDNGGGTLSTVEAYDPAAGQSGKYSGPIIVSDPAVVGSAATVTATAGAPFTQTVAPFTDPGGAEAGSITSSYQVTSIDWGDGTAVDTVTGTISYAGSPGSTTSAFTVTGSHTYAAAGPYAVTVTLSHEGVTTTINGTATVNNQAKPVLTWANPAAITYGTALSATQLNATANVPGT